MSTRQFKPGDRVAYSVQFLASIDQRHGEIAQARGTITETKQLGKTTLATIDWDGPQWPAKVNTANLAHVGPNRGFCQC